jgi:predicted alpha/beta hydrolase
MDSPPVSVTRLGARADGGLPVLVLGRSLGTSATTLIAAHSRSAAHSRTSVHSRSAAVTREGDPI